MISYRPIVILRCVNCGKERKVRVWTRFKVEPELMLRDDYCSKCGWLAFKERTRPLLDAVASRMKDDEEGDP